MAPEVVGHLTPRLFDMLIKRWIEDQERLDWRAGMVASVIANANRDSKVRPDPFTPRDFMPQWGDKAPEPMTAEETVAFAAQLNALLGGVDLRGMDG